ncbi:hypothetical protein D3C81_2205370 [compost metagenome]
METNGTAIFLPMRSRGELIPEPLRATRASAAPIWVAIRKVSTGNLRVAAAANGLEPR